LNQDNINIEYLFWDTTFFNIKIGRVILNEEIDLNEILLKANEQEYKLLYIFSKTKLSHSLDNFFNCKLLDTKLTFEKSLVKNQLPSNPQIFDLLSEKVNINNLEILHQLAYESGAYSRFKIDQNIGESKFKLLYETWINNSLNYKIATNFLVFKNYNEILGLVTIKTNIIDKTAQFGLLSVKEEDRGKGIGSSLLHESETILLNAGIEKLSVETQKLNSFACNFYLKNKFLLQKTEYIYHFWI
jgi:dTDP-4-amino-4,6-dideoxy-D-galactose acyltransferase